MSRELPGRSYRAALHLGDPRPANMLAHTTYCGRLVDEVIYWAAVELAEAPDFLTTRRRCRSCIRSLERRRRG